MESLAIDSPPAAPHPSGRAYVRTYPKVRRAEDYQFLVDSVVRAGGRVLYASASDSAPLFLTVEDEQGTRHGLMAYVFHANKNAIRNRPPDEHRMQVRYGNVNDRAWRDEEHRVGFDPTGSDLTLVLGVHRTADLLVALDPLLYDPLPLGISVFWKDREVDAARARGWHVWERENISGVRRANPRSQLGVETLVALAPERFFDYLQLEREAQTLGLDPALRYRAAERIGSAGGAADPHDGKGMTPGASAATLHALEEAYCLSAQEILEIIAERSRLAMAVRGGVAEHHAGRALHDDPLVVEAHVGDRDGPPDYYVELVDGGIVKVEVKNASPKKRADGTPKVEVQKTRASRGDALSRFYRPDAFDVLAACMAGPTGRWDFRYRRSDRLARHPRHPDRIAPIQWIDDAWHDSLGDALAE